MSINNLVDGKKFKIIHVKPTKQDGDDNMENGIVSRNSKWKFQCKSPEKAAATKEKIHRQISNILKESDPLTWLVEGPPLPKSKSMSPVAVKDPLEQVIALTSKSKFQGKSPEKAAAEKDKRYRQISSILKESDPLAWFVEAPPSPNFKGINASNSTDKLCEEGSIIQRNNAAEDDKAPKRRTSMSNQFNHQSSQRTDSIYSFRSNVSSREEERSYRRQELINRNSWLLRSDAFIMPESICDLKQTYSEINVEKNEIHRKVDSILKESDFFSWLEGPPKPKARPHSVISNCD